MRIAVIADVHGNLPALEAVLADISRRGGAERVVNLGDCASGPLWPRETVERLAALDATTVRGNHDRQVGMAASVPVTGASDRFACEQITQPQQAWLLALPPTAEVIPGVVAFHGTPVRDDAYLVEAVREGALVRDGTEAITRRLGDVGPCRIALCGHSHRPDAVLLPGGVLVVNPGSVGCPAYDDGGADPPHVSEAGTPHARYALIDLPAPLSAAQVAVQFLAVPYLHEDAARRADANGRPEWAHALRTGFMPWRG